MRTVKIIVDEKTRRSISNLYSVTWDYDYAAGWSLTAKEDDINSIADVYDLTYHDDIKAYADSGRYVVRDKEAGNDIETKVKTLDEAENLVAKFEAEDRANGCYEPNFYEIYDAVKETTW